MITIKHINNERDREDIEEKQKDEWDLDFDSSMGLQINEDFSDPNNELAPGQAENRFNKMLGNTLGAVADSVQDAQVLVDPSHAPDPKQSDESNHGDEDEEKEESDEDAESDDETNHLLGSIFGCLDINMKKKPKAKASLKSSPAKATSTPAPSPARSSIASPQDH